MKDNNLLEITRIFLIRDTTITVYEREVVELSSVVGSTLKILSFVKCTFCQLK